MKPSLEDNFEDVLGKAKRGLKLEDAAIAAKAGIPVEAWLTLLDGEFSEVEARAVAPVLKLDPDALVALAKKEYQPNVPVPDCVAQIPTEFSGGTVNAYLVWCTATKSAVVFDTGMDATPLLALAQQKGVKIEAILITHGHRDHVADLTKLSVGTHAPAYAPEGEDVVGAEVFEPGREFSIGKLRIETRKTWGHAPAGVTYVLEGLDVPVAIVGDAIFAGSMGGGGVDYQAALRTNREQILSLPRETVLCPGHGPLTTVGLELENNPFFAKD
jgi:hydroxyacylglutathione hydrolase